MPATILNAAAYTNTTTLPITLSSGSNRRIIVDEFRITGAGNVTAGTGLTLGGVAGRFDGGSTANTAYLRNAVRKYSWGEAEIAAMVGNTLATVGGSGGTVRFLAYSIQDASQSDLPTNNFTHNSAPSVGTGSISLARTDNGFTCVNLAFGVNVNATMSNPAKVASGTSNNEHVGYQSDNSGTAAAATFSGNSGLTPYSHLIVNYKPTPSQAITSINSGAGIRIGSTGNVAVTTGFTVDPDTITVGSLSGIITGYDSGTGEVTFDVPGPTHEDPYTDIDSTQTVTISVGSESAALNNVPFEPPLGSTPITVASPVNDDDRYLGYWMIDIFGVTPVNGDKFYGIDADVTWAADTGGSAVGLPVTTPVTYWDASTGIAYNLMVTVNPDGVVSAGGLSVSGLSVSGLSVSGLSVKCL